MSHQNSSLSKKSNFQKSDANTKSESFFVQPQQPQKPHTPAKKPFNKAKWRQMKYSVKHKLDNWKEQKKKTALRRYREEKSVGFDVQKIYVEEERRQQGEDAESEDKKMKKSFKKPHERFAQFKEERRAEREDMVKVKAEKAAALKKSKEMRLEKLKKFNKKTKKGQPIMKERMEFLLEKIEQNRELYSSSLN